MDFPTDERTSTYDPTNSQLTGIDATNGADLSFTYDGSLPTKVAWEHTEVAGSVQYDYNNDFRVTQQTIQASGVSEATVTYAYEADGLLTQAGDLSLTRNADNGLLQQVSLDSFQTNWTHNNFGEPVMTLLA